MRLPSFPRRPGYRTPRSAGRALLATTLTAVMFVTFGCTGAGDDAESAGPLDKPEPGILDRAPVASAEAIASSETAQAIRERGELLVGSLVNLPLMSQRNPATGQTHGFDALLSKMLAKYIIGEPDTKRITATASSREELLRVGTVDVVLSVYSITPQRSKKVTFAGPYLYSGQAIGTLKSTNNIDSVEDLNGKTVVALKSSTSAQAVKRAAPRANLITYRTSAQAIRALEEGEADAYVVDLTILAGIAQLNQKIEIAGGPFTKEPYGIGIQHGDLAFKRFINDWLRKIQSMGLWKKAWQMTLGTVLEGKPPKPPEIGTTPGS